MNVADEVPLFVKLAIIDSFETMKRAAEEVEIVHSKASYKNLSADADALEAAAKMRTIRATS